jgi:anaerobic ribonucleoside-triphosphate reductase
MPAKEQEYMLPPASLTDDYYGGGDALGTIMFFLNPLFRGGEEFYHGIKDAGYKNDEEIEQMMKEIDERVNEKEEKEYKKCMERRLNEEAYRKLTIENETAELQYEKGIWEYAVEREKYQNKAKSKASRKSGTSRRKSRRTTGNDRSNVSVKVENTNTNTNGLDYFIKMESPEEVAKKIKQYVR